MIHPRRWVRRRLHRRLFLWFGASILAAFAAFGLTMRLLGPDWTGSVHGARQFAASALSGAWDDPDERRRLVTEASRDFGVGIELLDERGSRILRVGDLECRGPLFVVPIEREGRRLGTARACKDHRFAGLPFMFSLAAAGAALFVLSGFVSRRIGRPLSDLSRVAREIGSGNLQSRVRLGRHAPGEMGELADAINDMTVRIERQLEDQRELLAGVSHEIRTPLGRLRVLLEIVRDRGPTPENLDAMEREIREVDDLVAELLASARLDFSALEARPFAVSELAASVLNRAGLPFELLRDGAPGAMIEADPTLLARALANLLDNAERHGGGVVAIGIVDEGESIAFQVDDAGPGFDLEFLPRAFDSFARSGGATRSGTSLGLGLSLVRRIARAHGGTARAENRPEGGARLEITVPKMASRRVDTPPSR